MFVFNLLGVIMEREADEMMSERVCVCLPEYVLVESERACVCVCARPSTRGERERERGQLQKTNSSSGPLVKTFLHSHSPDFFFI